MTSLFPSPFLKALQKNLKGFKRLSESHQHNLASVIWNLPRYRKHNLHDGAYSISYQELNRRFKRGQFLQLNKEVQALEQSEHLGLGSTKSYRLTDKVAKIRESYLKNRSNKPSELLHDDGRKVRKVWKNAIVSKDANGDTIKAWQGVQLPSLVKVNVPALEASEKDLSRKLKNPEGQADLWAKKEVNLLERLTATRQLLALANTQAGGEGAVPHRYVEHDAGRLYATGVNLQTVPLLVRAVALQGLWDYDIEACHYALLAQMAHKAEMTCPAIDKYVADKNRLRNALAKKIGISRDQVKRCLTALIYGARNSVWEDEEGKQSAIAKEIGVIKAMQLILDEDWLAIKRDIQKVRREVLKKAKRTTSRAGKRIINVLGKGIEHDADPKETLSHLLQGAEAQILREVIRMHGKEIVLPLHDGWVSRSKLDCAALEREIQNRLGWTIRIEEKRLQPSETLGR